MRLTVLLDNTVLPEGCAREDKALKAEHGSCFYIEAEGRTFLFDLGFTDLFASNATKLGLSLTDVSAVVFSHHHYDHTGGVRTLPSVSNCRRIIAHPWALFERLNEKNFLRNQQKDFEFTLVQSEPFPLTENLVFLGEIPSSNTFETRQYWGKVLVEGKPLDDFCRDDSALIYHSKKGIVVITGCSHSGICNIISYAREVAEQKWGITKIEAVIGGMHLIDKPQMFMDQVISSLKENGATNLYPSHCTDLSARVAFARADLTVHAMGTGARLVFPQP